jgi:hypothetical protein
MARDHETIDWSVPQRVRIDVIERAEVVADRAGPAHELAAVTALIAVAEDHSSFLVLVAVLPRPGTAPHNLLTGLDMNELFIREQAQFLRAVHLNPREQFCGHRRIDEAHNPRALAVTESCAPLDDSVG